jgi:hypothetical protein
METVTKEKTTFKLPNKKVLVVPVRRKGGWLPDNHENNFLFKHSYYKVGVPRNRRTGELVDPLNDSERDYFESLESGLSLENGELSVYKKDRNFWKNFTVQLDKNILILDLNNPMDYIRYKVLLVNKDTVAPSADEQFNKGTYKFAIVEEDYQVEERAKKAASKTEAYKAFGRMMDSPTKLRDFLNVYYFVRPGGKTVAPNAKLEFLQGEVESIIEKNTKEFLDVCNDVSYDTKVLIYRALESRALNREGLTYKTTEGKKVGDNLNEAIAFFDNVKNNEEILRIKSRIENTK